MAAGMWAVVESGAERARHVDAEPLGYAVGAFAWFLAAGVFVAAKFGISEMPPWTLCFFRVGIATLVLLPVTRHHWHEMRDFLQHRWLAVLITGGIGLCITQGFMYQALTYTTAINIGIIFGTAPMITMVLARVVLGEQMTAAQGLASLVALAGLVVIAVQGSLKVLLGLDLGVGDLLVVVAAILFSIYTVLLKREKFALPRLPLLVVLLGAASIVAFPLFLYEVAIGAHSNLNTKGWIALLYVAVPGGALMYLLYNWSIDLLGAGKAGVMMYLQMIFTTFLAWLLLGEQIQSFHLIGGGLILVGVVLVLWLKPKAPPAKPA